MILKKQLIVDILQLLSSQYGGGVQAHDTPMLCDGLVLVMLAVLIAATDALW